MTYYITVQAYTYIRYNYAGQGIWVIYFDILPCHAMLARYRLYLHKKLEEILMFEETGYVLMM